MQSDAVIRFEGPEDRALYRRPAAQPGVEFYRARIRDHRFEAHSHEAYGLGVITDGLGRFRWRGGEHLAPRASLMLMNPEDLHTGQSADAGCWAYHMVYLEEDLLPAYGGDRSWRFDAAVSGSPDQARAVACCVQALWQAQEPLAVDSLLLQLVELIRPHARVQGRPAEAGGRFEPVLDFMRSQLDQVMSLDQLAAVAGLSPFHFLRSFRAQHHATPQQVLMALRSFEAKRLLAQGQTPAEVAAATGFSDQSHLTRSLLSRYGVTPAAYQRQLGLRGLRRGR
ncbi:AraC family transcriptional regulator [Mitsuaria sp. WAJ17]|uniref:AraC family transcriptional regulator n=1 Tax=Mitsuaria sp. WAJ17 TaxID=2761452 RepID=UPI00160352FD|nr:AraC family transcriptional regulator [Mitsuaria sp. WAJ17]MBB2487297.1 AraC family transcriptional regulator [Mitsuaria sp. WAJ17]